MYQLVKLSKVCSLVNSIVLMSTSWFGHSGKLVKVQGTSVLFLQLLISLELFKNKNNPQTNKQRNILPSQMKSYQFDK